jgi:hypothetical protein
MANVAAPAAPVETSRVSGLSALHRRVVNEYLARKASAQPAPATAAVVPAAQPAGFAPVPRSRRMAAWVRTTPAPARIAPPHLPTLTGPGTPAGHARHPFGTGVLYGEDGGAPIVPDAPGGMWTDADEHHAREEHARWEARHAAAKATTDDAPPPAGALTLAGWVASEAARYRALGTLAGELVGAHLADLAKLITFTQARTPAEAADRLASLDDYHALGR